MKILIQQNVFGGALMYEVYFLIERPNGRDVGRFEKLSDGPAELVFSAFEEGAVVEPTLRLPMQAAEALKTALDEHGPLSADSLAFVKDAIGTRDRLLTLVERLTTSKDA